MPYPTEPKAVSGAVSTGQTLLRVVDPVTLNEMEREARAIVQEETQDAWVHALTRRIRTAFELSKRWRLEAQIDDIMIAALNQRDGRYDDDIIAAITEQGASDVYMQLTAVKCRAFESWVTDIYDTTMGKPWFLDPTPDPEISPEATQQIVQRTMQMWMQKLQRTGQAPTQQDAWAMAQTLRARVENEQMEYAREAASRMGRKIHDQMVEGHWRDAFNNFLVDVGTLPVGVLKGPYLRKMPSRHWEKEGGRTVPVVEDRLFHTFSRVCPLDVFPAPGAESINDGDLCERTRWRRQDLEQLRGVPGYIEENITAVLANYGDAGYSSYRQYYDGERAEVEYKGDYISSEFGLIDGIDYWGSVPGYELLEAGLKEDHQGIKIDAAREYEANVVVSGDIPIYARINPDPLGRRPYSKSVYQQIPGSFWGKGIPQLMADVQQICNSAIRAMVYNLSMASGPQVVINDIARLPGGEDVEGMFPWKIWQFVNNGLGGSGKPIDFYQPDSRAAELANIYKMFAQIADDYTGIPAYTYGNERISGAGRTMGGLSMLMTAAARGIKKVVTRIHEDVIEDVVQKLYDWNMTYLEDESLKGDAKIRPVGIIAIIMREQMADRRLAILDRMDRSPESAAIFGPEGKAELWRKALESMEIDPDQVVKSDEEIMARVRMLQQAAAQERAQEAGPGQPPQRQLTAGGQGQ